MNALAGAPSVEEKLAELLAAKDARNAARAEAALARKVAFLELEAKLEKEIGPRGSLFDMVDTEDGPVAVKLGAAVLHVKFMDSKCENTDVHAYVFPCVVYPEKEIYLQIAAQRPGLPNLLAKKLMSLFQGNAKDDAGK